MEVSDNENSQPPPDDKTSTSIIQESVVPERCDFILKITAEQFNSLFPKSEDDHGKSKMGFNESYNLAQKYCKRQQKNNYTVSVHYFQSTKTNPNKGRQFADCGIQNIKANCRRFLQTGLYYDFDMMCAHPSIHYVLCKKHDLPRERLKRFLDLYFAGKREEFFKRSCINKHEFLTKMNQDKPKFNKKQQKKIELIYLFTELNQSKKELHDIYSKKGFKSNKDSKNPLSSLINAVWVDNENEILKTALSKIDRSCWGPLAFDGFQSTQKIDPKILNSEFIKWTEKPNTHDIDMQKYLNELEAMKIIKWRVPREEYLYTDATGRPRARPYTADPETGCVSIVECSEMNMGKTLQLYRLVLRQFTTRDMDWCVAMIDDLGFDKHKFSDETPARRLIKLAVYHNKRESIRDMKKLGNNVLIVLHRVALITDLQRKYFEGIGFTLYSDETGDITEAGKHIVCIDSLWRIKDLENYDLIATDEAPAVLESLCRLKQKRTGSGKWTCHRTLQTLLKECEHKVIMSAQADQLVKDYLDDCRVSCHWQMNKTPTLDHLHYKFCHYFTKADEFMALTHELDQNKKIVVPCAEQKHAEAVHMIVSRKYPEKKFLLITSHCRDKDAAIVSAISNVYDGLIYTSALDCGVSIEVLGYDKIVFYLNSRSINADTVMQMILRVRNLNENEVIFVCDKLVKDWMYNPPYRHEVYMRFGKPQRDLPKAIRDENTVLEDHSITSISKVYKHLWAHNSEGEDDVYWFSSRTSQYYRFFKAAPPPELSFEDAKRIVMGEAKINEVLSNDHDFTSLKALLDEAESMVIEQAIQNKNKPLMGLVNLIIKHYQRHSNQPRNIVNEINRIAVLQGAKTSHHIIDSAEDSTIGNGTGEKLEIKEQRSLDVMEAESVDMGTLRKIQKKRIKLPEEYDILNHAHMVATFGQDIVDNIGKHHMCITDISNMKKFRMLCSLMDPNSGFKHPENIFNGRVKEFTQCFDAPHKHEEAELVATCKLLSAFGFEHPNDDKSIEITNEVKGHIREALSEFKRVTGSSRNMKEDVVTAAICSLRKKFSVAPKRDRNTRLYKIEFSEIAKRWGTPTFQKAKQYAMFVDNINSQDTDNQSPPSSKATLRHPFDVLSEGQDVYQQKERVKRKRRDKLEASRKEEVARKRHMFEETIKRERLQRKQNPRFHGTLYPKRKLSEFIDGTFLASMSDNGQPKEQLHLKTTGNSIRYEEENHTWNSKFKNLTPRDIFTASNLNRKRPKKKLSRPRAGV